MSDSRPADYTIEELLATVIAKEVRNGEISVVGTLSPIPAAAVLLAKETHAHQARVMILGSDPWPFNVGSKEFFDLAQRGKLDLFFLSGAQIDAQANINLTSIGKYDRPRVRLPGGAGSGMLYYMAKRVVLFRTDHTARTFVPKVDFKTSIGVSRPNVYRPGGPAKVVTPLCVFAFDQASQGLVLESLQPGVAVELVKANTGFPIIAKEPVATIAPPTREELQVLRTVVRKRLSDLYPQFAASAFLAAS